MEGGRGGYSQDTVKALVGLRQGDTDTRTAEMPLPVGVRRRAQGVGGEDTVRALVGWSQEAQSRRGEVKRT